MALRLANLPWDAINVIYSTHFISNKTENDRSFFIEITNIIHNLISQINKSEEMHMIETKQNVSQNANTDKY